MFENGTDLPSLTAKQFAISISVRYPRSAI